MRITSHFVGLRVRSDVPLFGVGETVGMVVRLLTARPACDMTHESTVALLERLRRLRSTVHLHRSAEEAPYGYELDAPIPRQAACASCSLAGRRHPRRSNRRNSPLDRAGRDCGTRVRRDLAPRCHNEPGGTSGRQARHHRIASSGPFPTSRPAPDVGTVVHMQAPHWMTHVSGSRSSRTTRLRQVNLNRSEPQDRVASRSAGSPAKEVVATVASATSPGAS
jgi:hypothetical protein